MATVTGAPLVSVITATYNSSATLKLALQSVLRQDLRDLELWVIGDACTDDSEAVVAALGDSRVHWDNLPRNSGSQSAPNNEGVRRARGRYVSFIGHDDLWLPWHLSELVKHLENGSADLVHSLCPLIVPEGVLEVIGPPRDGVGYDLHSMPPSSWLLRHSLAVEVGPWRSPDSLSRSIDLDLTRRLYLANKRIECVPTVSVFKFPSKDWRTYARQGEPPQAAFWQAIQQDPQLIVRQVLTDFVLAYDRRFTPGGNVSARVAWRDLFVAGQRAVRSTRNAMLDGYGRERWPLNAILPTMYRRRRKALRQRRGLAP